MKQRAFNNETKDETLEDISHLLGIQIHRTARGGTVLIEFFQDVANWLSLDASGGKLEILRRCFDGIGKDWRPEYSSERTPSRGGGTVTALGLKALYDGLLDFVDKKMPGDPLFLITLADYIEATEHYSREVDFSPGIVDVNMIADGIERHNKTQNQLAIFLQSHGVKVFSPVSGTPEFDILWEKNSKYFLGEVKSITPENEESQMRTAVGQVLRYKSQLKQLGLDCLALIVTDQAVIDVSWFDVCEESNIYLTYPDMFENLLTI